MINRSSGFIDRLALNRIGISKYMVKNTLLESTKTDLSDRQNAYEKYVKCHSCCNLSGNSHHCSVIFRGKLDEKCVISYGQNKFSPTCGSVHAEADAINKLQYIKSKKSKKPKKTISVDMLVIKVLRNGKLSNSAPCVKCLKSIANAITKGYKINKVYYSNETGNIECKLLSDLINSEKLHISSYYRNSNFNMNKWFSWRDKYNKTFY
jgi:hypothetical protein